MMGDLIEIMPGKFTDRITNAELMDVLGMEDREDLDAQGDTIQVCAGAWKRIDATFWGFDADKAFDA